MENKVIEMITSRIDRLEDKIDVALIEALQSKWKISSTVLASSFVLAVLVQIGVAWMAKKI